METSEAEAPQQPPAVAEWRRRRGFGGAPSGAAHKCESGTWSRVGVALLCDRCGFAHVRSYNRYETHFAACHYLVVLPPYDACYKNIFTLTLMYENLMSEHRQTLLFL